MSNNKFFIALVGVSALGLSLPTFAFSNSEAYNSGVYIGGQLGIAHTDYDLGAFIDKHYSKSDLAGRVYLGYQFNQFIGLETGFAMFSDADLPRDFGEAQTTHWDLLVKIGMPFACSGFRADAKVGGAHVMTNFDSGDLAKSLGIQDDSKWEIMPAAGVGVAYSISQNIALDVSYLHVFGDPKSTSFSVPTNDMLMLGVNFLFNV